MVAYLKASPQEKTYSDYLQATREAEKEDSMTYPEAPEAKQLIALPNPSLKGPSQQLKHLLCTWHTRKRRVPRKMNKWKARTLMASTG